MSLVIGIATRGRPELAAWTAETTLKNAQGDTTVVVLADADDKTMLGFKHPKGVILDVAERPDSVGAKWNRLLTYDTDLCMAMSDYRPQITPGFDLDVMEAASVFPDGIGVVYQHMANLSFAVYQTITRRMAEVMGHFYVEHFPYWFVDHWLDDVARMVGRFVWAKGDTEIRPRPGKGTQDFREPGLWATFYDSLYGEREATAERLFAVMDEPEWRKTMLRRNWNLIHQRSRLLNDHVRQMEGNAPFDDRYERIRKAAGLKLLSLYREMERKAA